MINTTPTALVLIHKASTMLIVHKINYGYPRAGKNYVSYNIGVSQPFLTGGSGTFGVQRRVTGFQINKRGSTSADYLALF